MHASTKTLIALTLTALASTLAPTSALALDDTGGTACQPLPGMPWAGTFKFVDGQLQPCVGEGASGGEVVVTKLPTFGKEDLYIESHHPKQPTRPAEHRPSCPAFRCMDRDLRPRGGADRDHFGYPGGGKGSGGGSKGAKKEKKPKQKCLELKGAMKQEALPAKELLLQTKERRLASLIARSQYLNGYGASRSSRSQRVEVGAERVLLEREIEELRGELESMEEAAREFHGKGCEDALQKVAPGTSDRK